jgi:hypothetical protein
MTALILFDPQHTSQDQVSQTCANLVAAHERVRLVQVGRLVPRDLRNVRYFVMACPRQHFAQSMQAAVDSHTDAGMMTLSLPDLQRMIWFRQQSYRRVV